jgi:hypothetical protein
MKISRSEPSKTKKQGPQPRKGSMTTQVCMNLENDELDRDASQKRKKGERTKPPPRPA